MTNEEHPLAPPATAAAAAAAPVKNVEVKARLLLLLLVALIFGAIGYLMYARGAFERTQTLVLVAEDAEGVRVGMDLSFSGFPIGRVRGLALGADGNARITVDIPVDEAHWLRSSSVFTLVRSVIGGTSLHAYSGVPTDPPLPDGAERKVLIGDTAAELQRVVTAASGLLQNLNRLTGDESPLAATLANLQATTDRLKGKHGALGVLMGSDEEAARIGQTLSRTNALLARLDRVVEHADQQLFGPQGVSTDARAAVRQLDALLRDARGSLQQLDAVLKEAEGVARNAKVATTDLGTLRAEVESSLRKVQRLVDELNRKWPFARESEELKLP